MSPVQPWSGRGVDGARDRVDAVGGRDPRRRRPGRRGWRRRAWALPEPAQHGDGESNDPDDAPSEDVDLAGDLGAQFGDAGLELLGGDVFAVFGGLADGVGHHVGLLAVDAGLGEAAGDRERVEHGFRVPRPARNGAGGGL